MNAVQTIFSHFTGWQTWHRLPDDLARAWAEVDQPGGMAEVLGRCYPFDEVAAPLRIVAEAAGFDAEAELKWRTPECLSNLAVLLTGPLPGEGPVPPEILLDAFRERFPDALVRILEVYEAETDA